MTSIELGTLTETSVIPCYWTQRFETCQAYYNRNIMVVSDNKQCLFIQQCKDVLVNITTMNVLFVFAIV